VKTLVLASSSPRRQELLTGLGFAFEVFSPNIDEFSEKTDLHLTPRELVWGNAFRKGRAAQRQHPGRRILAADTAVVLEGRLLGKPRNLKEAESYLRALSGQIHSVLTAVVLIAGNGSWQGLIEETRVEFHRLTVARIRRYLREVPVLDKAGAYAIQDQGDAIICRIDGSHSNVMGLPVERVRQLLQP
jgi:septum formation protein